MQAFPPPRNVILQPNALDTRKQKMMAHLQVGINSRDLSVLDCIWHGVKPSLWLPFQSILSPDCLVPVARSDANSYHRLIWHQNLLHHCTVYTFDRFREREHHIPSSSMNQDIRAVIPDKAMTVNMSLLAYHKRHRRVPDIPNMNQMIRIRRPFYSEDTHSRSVSLHTASK